MFNRLTFASSSATFSWKWNPYAPAGPGEHGVVFDTLKTFNDGAPIGHQAIPFFIREGPNDWKLQGCYTVEQYGEISQEDLPRMPPGMVTTYEKGIATATWGKAWIEDTNNGLPLGVEPIIYSEDNIRAALVDGRLKFTFTIMKCVEYRTEMLDRLELFRVNPKPSKSSKKQPRKRDLEEVEQGDLPKDKQKKKVRV